MTALRPLVSGLAPMTHGLGAKRAPQSALVPVALADATYALLSAQPGVRPDRLASLALGLTLLRKGLEREQRLRARSARHPSRRAYPKVASTDAGFNRVVLVAACIGRRSALFIDQRQVRRRLPSTRKNPRSTCVHRVASLGEVQHSTAAGMDRVVLLAEARLTSRWPGIETFLISDN